MKKILLLLILFYTGVHQIVAAESDWYLYIWSNTNNSGGDVGQFQTTAENGVFRLDRVTTTESGLKFCIHNSAWTTQYAWSSGSEGMVSATATDIALGIASGATGWLGLEAGNYNVMFNANAPSIRFDVSPISYTTYPDGHALAIINDYLRGGDISMLNYVESLGAKFYDADGTERDPLDIMQQNGVNIVRLRLYNNPGKSVTYNGYTYRVPEGFLCEEDVLNLARQAKAHGMKILLTFHYSDFWTNGEMQFKPEGWETHDFNQLGQAVYDYTHDFLLRMNAQGTTPDFVSLGNEIQGGFLFGHYNNPDAVSGYASNKNMSRLADLLGQGSAAVRSVCPDAKVVIHLTLSTGVTESTYQWFFDAMCTNNLDYDIIGTSYYPFWTNERPSMLTSLANNMYSRYGKDLLIMEVGYSWTPYLPSGRTKGNYEGQLHLNGTPYNEATKEGQKAFMHELQTVIKQNAHILGYLYWDPVMVDQKVGGTWIETAWAQRKSDGNWYQDGNVVSNTTWFDYEGKALPVFEAIGEDAITLPSHVNINGTTYTVESNAPFELSIGSTGYSTFYDRWARTLPDALTAYTVQNAANSSITTLQSSLPVIPADCGVLLHGNEGTYYLWPRLDNKTNVSGNMLYGTAIRQTIATPQGNYYYYKLADDSTHGLGWYWGETNGGVFSNGANKAYLAIPQNLANARSFISLFDDTDGIRNIADANAADTACYDPQGRRKNKSSKGFCITHGKKKVKQ